MAAFRTHITVSTLGGIGVAAAGYNYGIPLESCLLALGLCSVSGMLPDLDSSSGIPFRESVAFISAFVPMLLISRFQHFGWDRETIILAAALIYIGIRFGIAEVFRRYTVHRGMWHSLPAAASVGLLAFLITDDRDLILRCYWGGTAVAGFMSHLILDEIYSVNFRGVRLKNSFGTAVKLWSRRGLWPNVSTYGKLAVLVLLAWGDPMLMKWVEQRETVTLCDAADGSAIGGREGGVRRDCRQRAALVPVPAVPVHVRPPPRTAFTPAGCRPSASPVRH